jgi:murein DD-endopeptidase MepM/ murein hydrolase activator NlpD
LSKGEGKTRQFLPVSRQLTAKARQFRAIHRGYETISQHFGQMIPRMTGIAFTASNYARRVARPVAVVLTVLALAACAHNPHRSYYGPAPGSYFAITVRSGDTLSEIALRYRVDEDDLVAMNRLRDRDDLFAGQMLKIPAYGRLARHAPTPRTRTAHAKTPPRAAPARKPAASSTRVAQAPAPASKPATHTRPVQSAVARIPTVAQRADAQFAWPLDGVILSSFGARNNGERNDGINIACAGGEEIRAAADGVVTYVGNELKGYGNLILIKHDNGYTTAYAHADQITVRKGERVKQGQVIATAGATGDVDEPQLHFELRRGVTPVDPRPYLRA